MKYYTKNPTTKRLILQPNYITTEAGTTVNPSAAQWAAIGAYPRADDPAPTPPDGKIAMLDDYEVRYGEWHALWRYDDAPPPPPRTFSKLRIVSALTQAGVWDSVKQLLIARRLYDLFLAAQEFAEANEYFAQGKSALQSALGWTDEQVEAVLAASVKE